MVVHALGGEAVVAVALDLVAQRADHLAVADVAALADVDVAAGQLERRVGPHALHLLDRARRARTAARSRRCRRSTTTTRMPISRTIEFFSKIPWFMIAALTPPARRGIARSSGAAGDARLLGDVVGTSPRIVRQMLIGHDQRADQEQQAAEGADDVVGSASPRPSRRRSMQEAAGCRRRATSGPA